MRTLFYISLCFICSFNISGQINTQSQFKYIAIDQGHINDIIRDSEGYIWLCTQDGLTKYNSHDWIQYNHTKGDSNSISHNYVWCSFEDKQGIMWLGTFGGGLNSFDKRSGKFKSFLHDSIKLRSSERVITQLESGNLLVGTDYGLYEFDPEALSYVYDSTFLNNQFNVGYYHTHFLLKIDSTNYIGSGGNGGVWFNVKTKRVRRLEIEGLEEHLIGEIIKINDNSFLAADQSWVHLLQLEPGGKHHFKKVHSFYLAETPDITTLYLVDSTSCLVGSQDGLFLLNLDDETVSKIPESNDLFQNGLTDRIIYSICEIEENLFWIGTKTSIFAVSNHQPSFKHIKSNMLCNGAILGMHEDQQGNLWVASRKGLCRIENFNLDESKWTYHCYNQENEPNLRNDYILNIWELNGKLCLGYRRKGFQYFTPDADGRLILEDPQKSINDLTKDYSVSNAAIDRLGRYWLGTSGNGIIVHDPIADTTRLIKSMESDSMIFGNYIFDMIQFHPDTMSAGNQSGIVNINIKDFNYSVYASHPERTASMNANFVMDFKIDDSHRHWVTTDGGLHLWKKDNSFSVLTRKDGLPNDVVYGIEGARDSFWISTNKGICRIIFDETNNPSFKTFDSTNGVLDNEHNQFAHYESSSGHLLFGGKNGITYFRSKDIVENSIQAIPVIERFSLFNKDSTLFNGQHINHIKKITLQPNENFIGFDIAGLSYRNSENNQFRYRLKGLNTQWIDLGNRNYLSFNGLTPGDYTLEIQASNDDGAWSNSVKTLDITLMRPILLRWYAWILYFLVLILLAYLFYKQKLSNLRNIAAAKEAERTKIRERSARDFHDEAGTILTRLTLLTQYLKGSVQPESPAINTIDKLENNLQLLRNGMRDFIWVLDPNKDSLSSLYLRINEIGQQIFEHSQIDFKCTNHSSPEFDNIEINGNQRRHLTMACKESLNNIVKHSNANSTHVDLNIKDSILEILIRDDGRGFDQNQNNSGHGITNITSRMQKIGGLFNLETKSGKGTSISLILPIHPNGL